MTVPVRGKVPLQWNEQTARHITERLQALERALAGGAPQFLAPAVPTFGTGTVTGGAGGGTIGAGTPSPPVVVQVPSEDIVPIEGSPGSHQHGPAELVGLNTAFAQHGDPPTPHLHVAADVIGQAQEDEVAPHRHVMADLSDVDMAQLLLTMEYLGG